MKVFKISFWVLVSMVAFFFASQIIIAVKQKFDFLDENIGKNQPEKSVGNEK